jgi:hypothetical protein
MVSERLIDEKKNYFVLTNEGSILVELGIYVERIMRGSWSYIITDSNRQTHWHKYNNRIYCSAKKNWAKINIWATLFPKKKKSFQFAQMTKNSIWIAQKLEIYFYEVYYFIYSFYHCFYYNNA